MNDLEKIARLVRYYILTATTAAGSGHPSSSLSGVELLTALLFGGFFRADLNNPALSNNDRLIFSKGHAAPLFYALYAAAGVVDREELLTLRKFGSRLEGHPTLALPYTEAATGSLGQGLSVGVGMGLNAKLDRLTYRTFVLLGDSEMAEGSQWEAMQIAAYYKLDNLIGIIDVNRLGQRGETMYGHDLDSYARKVSAFGWEAVVVEDGHSLPQIIQALEHSQTVQNRPTMIIARTIKGKGVSFIEDKEGWHGRPLPVDDLKKALAELGAVDKTVRGEIAKPPVSIIRHSGPPAGGEGSLHDESQDEEISRSLRSLEMTTYAVNAKVSTRRAYGNALARIGAMLPNMVVLDAEVSNSTFSELFKAKYPKRFFEMFIAEQNMVGVALGFSRRRKIPFVSTFAAFMTRAFDQIRMAQYSDANIKFCGSHAGVSIGEDGASQMGLEDLAMFREILGSVVLYPSDAISTERLVEEMAAHHGIAYIRTTRMDTPILYRSENYELGSMNQENLMAHDFKIGESCTLRSSTNDCVTIVAAGVTLHEALATHEELKKEGIAARVIDLYSIKPLDVATLQKAARETRAIITVEDHFADGGIGEAVASALGEVSGVRCQVIRLAVRKMPRSGKPAELLDYEEISRSGIIKKVREILSPIAGC